MNQKLNWYFDSAKIIETKVLRPSLISAAEASGDGCRKSFGIEIPIAQENTEVWLSNFFCLAIFWCALRYSVQDLQKMTSFLALFPGETTSFWRPLLSVKFTLTHLINKQHRFNGRYSKMFSFYSVMLTHDWCSYNKNLIMNKLS